jgi:hypothetical protein
MLRMVFTAKLVLASAMELISPPSNRQVSIPCSSNIHCSQTMVSDLDQHLKVELKDAHGYTWASFFAIHRQSPIFFLKSMLK